MKSDAFDRERERYQLRTPKARELNRQAKEVLPGGSSRGTAYFDPYPIFADHGKGHYLYDVDGNAYLDFMINATSLIMGHAHPDVVNALQRQAARGTAFSAPTELQTRLSSILCDRIPSVDSVRFTNSGTEGTLMAIRAARAFTGRHKIAKFEGGYHGSHEYAAVSVRPPASALDPEGPSCHPRAPRPAPQRRRGRRHPPLQQPGRKRLASSRPTPTNSPASLWNPSLPPSATCPPTPTSSKASAR